MTSRPNGSALAASLLAKRGDRERAEQVLARRIHEQRDAEVAVERALETSAAARSEAEGIWCTAAEPARLQLLRAGAQEMLERAERGVTDARETLVSARAEVERARKAYSVAAAGEEAVARLVERRARDEATLQARRRSEEGE